MKASAPAHSAQMASMHKTGFFDYFPGSEAVIHDLLTLAGQVTSSSVYGIAFIQRSGEFVSTVKGMEPGAFPASNAFFDQLRNGAGALTVYDAHLDERFRKDSLVKGKNKIKFFTAFPLYNRSGKGYAYLFFMARQPSVFTESQTKCINILLKQLHDVLGKTGNELSKAAPRPQDSVTGITGEPGNSPGNLTITKLQKKIKELSDYKLALDKSSIVAITDEHGIITYANDNFCKISKYSREELIGQDHRIINSGYHSKLFFKNLWTTITKGKIWKGEIKNKAKDGTHYWVAITIVPFLNEDGTPYQYVAIREDITWKKTIEEDHLRSLKETSDYKYALDESSIVTIANQDGTIQYANSNFCRLSQYDREELLQQNHPLIDPDCNPKNLIRNIWRSISKGNTWKGEIKNTAKDGSIYWVQTVIVPFLNEEEKPYQYVSISTDITSNKLTEEKIKTLNQALTLSEKKFRALIENSNDLITLVDENFVTKYRSPSASRILGWPEEELDKKSGIGPIHPEDVKLVAEVRQALLTKPAKPFTLSFRMQHKAGNYIWLEGTMINLLQDPSLEGIVINLKDITERKNSEALLIEKTKQISDILERINDGFIALDKNFNYTYVNNRMGEMTGHEPAALIGKNIWEQFPEIINTPTYEAFTTAMESQEYVENVEYQEALDLWQQNHIYPSPDGLLVFVRDISNQKKSEKAIRMLHERLSFHLSNSPLALIEFDSRFLITNWSDQAAKMFGYAEDEVLGKSMAELLLYEDTVELMELRQKLNNGELDSYKVRTKSFTRNGSVIFCEWYNSVLRDENRNIHSILSLAQDITERVNAEHAIKESEEKYRLLIEEATDGIAVFEPGKNKFITANPRMTDLLGYSKEELLSIEPEIMVIEKDTIANPFTIELTEAEMGYHVELELLRKDGMVLPAELSIKLMHDLNYLVFIRDITDRKKAELEIIQLNEGLEQMVAERTSQLETVNKDLEAFSYSVSHDLRAPLRAVNGYANILEEEYNSVFDNEGKRLLREVQSNAKRMGTLIDDLLTFSRMGRKPIVTTLINMNGLCITAFDELGEDVKNKVTLILNPLDNAMADFALIKQVMINLLSNAIKYSSKNENPIVEVSSWLTESEVVFSIKDNGVGFDMKYINKLFGVFQRLHSSDEFEGTGVGLATVFRIISKHGGNVWAESVLNEGATFYFSLPVNPVS